MVPVLEEVGDEQEQAARSLGANALQTFRRITLPAIKWGVIYGVVLSLARSLGEFGAVKVVSGNVLGQTRTATLVVEEKYLNFDKGGAYATAFLLALVAVACIIVVIRHPAEGRPLSIEIANVDQALRRVRRARRRVGEHPLRAAHRAARPVRRRQVHPAAHHRRPGDGRQPAGSRSKGVDATHLPPQKRNVGFVFQHYAAFKHLSVRRNVAFGLEIRKRPKDEIRARVDELLALVHLEQFADRLPSQLSGGQRQRMALARALAVKPTVLLLDEPFGALDAKVRKELRDWLRRLHDEVHVTTVFVTHDQEEALEVADEIVVINEGRVEQIGSPDELYDQPANDFVMRFLGPVTQLGRPAGPSARPAGAHRRRPSRATSTGRITRITRIGFEIRVEVHRRTDQVVTVTLHPQRVPVPRRRGRLVGAGPHRAVRPHAPRRHRHRPATAAAAHTHTPVDQGLTPVS